MMDRGDLAPRRALRGESPGPARDRVGSGTPLLRRQRRRLDAFARWLWYGTIPGTLARAAIVGSAIVALACVGRDERVPTPDDSVMVEATGPPSPLADAGAVAAPLDAGDTAATTHPGTRPARATPEVPVYLNEADADELRRLPGVGAKRAHAILALRTRLGRFRRVEDLLRVKGIGRSAIKKWRGLVRLESAREVDAGAGQTDAGDGASAARSASTSATASARNL